MEEMTIDRTATRPLSDVEHAHAWLERFNAALRSDSTESLAALFVDDSHWRDLMAFTWTITPHDGRARIVEGLMQAQPTVQARDFRLAAGLTPPRRIRRIGNDVIECMIAFETQSGRGLGLLRLLVDQPSKAWVLMTSLEELKGFEEPIHDHRPSGDDYSRIFGGKNWSDMRQDEQAFADRDPAVLIVGA
ncbi:MAG: monooxygenase, partial [Burkholderiales bacterium]